jgi:hypothetical protein
MLFYSFSFYKVPVTDIVLFHYKFNVDSAFMFLRSRQDKAPVSDMTATTKQSAFK